MKLLFVLAIALLSGCAFYQTDHARIWFLCYKDDTMLANGMYQSTQLNYKCNKGGAGRSSIQFSYKPDVPENHALENGMKKYVQEHSGD